MTPPQRPKRHSEAPMEIVLYAIKLAAIAIIVVVVINMGMPE